MTELMGKLNSILADSIVLKMDLTIGGIGQDVEALMEVSSEEVQGESFADVCLDTDIQQRIEKALLNGYFVDMDANLWTRGGHACHVALSGFYLGLISDINGYIILKIKLKEDNSFLKKELFTKKREMDTFIYRTAHDLRGPLATIKGLVNLLKMRKTDIEVNELTALIEVHADKLDDRLFKLLYLANHHDIHQESKDCLNFGELESNLSQAIKDNCQLDKAIFHFNAPTEELCGVNEPAITRLLRHVVLYLVGLPLAVIPESNEIAITSELSVRNGHLSVRINARGFHASEPLRKVIDQPASLYTDMLSHPFLFNYYVAYKEAMMMSAFFKVTFFGESVQVLQLSIPFRQRLGRKIIATT